VQRLVEAGSGGIEFANLDRHTVSVSVRRA
jgi:hypothetical protein